MIKYLRKLKYVLNVMKSNESLFLPNCLDAKCTIYIIHTYILLFSQNKKGVIMQTIQPFVTHDIQNMNHRSIFFKAFD